MKTDTVFVNSVGASSILVATLLFMEAAAQAAETHQEVGNPESAVAQSIAS